MLRLNSLGLCSAPHGGAPTVRAPLPGSTVVVMPHTQLRVPVEFQRAFRTAAHGLGSCRSSARLWSRASCYSHLPELRRSVVGPLAQRRRPTPPGAGLGSCSSRLVLADQPRHREGSRGVACFSSRFVLAEHARPLAPSRCRAPCR